MPTFVPPVRVTSPRSNAERRVLDWLSRLSDEWTVIHALGVLNHQFKQWAEADVMLIGPPGVLVLEVKGGRVVREQGRWGFIDKRHRVTWRNDGPFDQAGGAHAAIRRILIGGLVLAERQCSGYAVLLPDSEFPPMDSSSIAEVLLDADDPWEDPNRVVRQWCHYPRSFTETWSDRRVEAPKCLLVRGSLDLRRFKFSSEEGTR